MAIPGVVEACSWGSVADQERDQRRYLAEVTSIYDGVITEMDGRQDDPLVTFTVRKTGEVWGRPGPERWPLSYELGACVNYIFLMEDHPEGEAPGNGLRVRVFVAPEARSRPERLFITPIGPTTDVLMSRWRFANRQRTQ